MYHHILIATDGSELAALGLDQGLALAATLRAQVTVVTVTEPMDPRVVQAAAIAGVHDAAEKYEETVTRDPAARFDAIGAMAARPGGAARTVSLIDASPASAIIAECKASGRGPIVMSSHGRRGLTRLLLGSQTAEVLALSSVPVLVVRQAQA